MSSDPQFFISNAVIPMYICLNVIETPDFSLLWEALSADASLSQIAEVG